MLRGLYAAASGLDANLFNQDVITENLAHAGVPGYRRQTAVFESFDPYLAAQPAAISPGTPAAAINGPRTTTTPPTQPEGGNLCGCQPAYVSTDFSQGAVKYTGNPFDVAAGNASTFFVVDGPKGPLLTRSGTFTLDNLNQLVTRGGLPVRGQAGRIVIPSTTASVVIGTEGGIIADGVQVDSLLLARVENPRGLVRAGDTLFQGPVPNGPPTPGSVRVAQGYVEEPNTNIVVDMVNMVSGLRHYEAAQRALRALDEAVAENTRPQG
jgi:flagellar basal-body rod protein FlgG